MGEALSERDVINEYECESLYLFWWAYVVFIISLKHLIKKELSHMSPRIRLSQDELSCAAVSQITSIPYQTLLQWKKSTTGQRRNMYYYLVNQEEHDLMMDWNEADSFALLNVDECEGIMPLKVLNKITEIHIQTLYAWRRRDLNYRRTLLYFLLSQNKDLLTTQWNKYS